MNALSKIGSAVALTLGVGTASAGLVIDDFSVGQAQLTDSTAGNFLPAPTSSYGTNLANDAGSGSSVQHASILGGERDLLVYKTVDQTLAPGLPDQEVSVEVDAGLLNYNAESRAGGFAVVRWDGVNGYGASINKTGLGSQNLTGYAGIQITADADKDFDITFQLWSGAGSVLSEVTKTITGGGGIVNELFTLNSFVGADFTNVGAMQMIINTAGKAIRLDVDIDMVGAVPEPGSLALAGLALMGLAAARRRKA